MNKKFKKLKPIKEKLSKFSMVVCGRKMIKDIIITNEFGSRIHKNKNGDLIFLTDKKCIEENNLPLLSPDEVLKKNVFARVDILALRRSRQKKN